MWRLLLPLLASATETATAPATAAAVATATNSTATATDDFLALPVLLVLVVLEVPVEQVVLVPLLLQILRTGLQQTSIDQSDEAGSNSYNDILAINSRTNTSRQVTVARHQPFESWGSFRNRHPCWQHSASKFRGSPSTYGCLSRFALALAKSQPPEYKVTATCTGTCDHALRFGFTSGGVNQRQAGTAPNSPGCFGKKLTCCPSPWVFPALQVRSGGRRERSNGRVP